MRRVTLAVFGASVVLTSTAVVSAASIHFIGVPTCTVGDDQVCCSGKVAGLGRAPTSVSIDVPFQCTNPAGHHPPGLAGGGTQPIPPRGGQITFEVCTTSAGCPPPHTPSFGPNLTLNIFQDGNLVFSATVPVSN